MDNVTFLKDRKKGGYIMDYATSLKPAFPTQMKPKIEGDPKNKVSKNITEMVADLKYHNAMLQANVETAREMQGDLSEYVMRTNMSEGVDELEKMSDEDIDSMTIKDIDIKFPGHQLMPYDAPEIKEIESKDYGYNEEDCHIFLKDIRDRIKNFRHIIDVINQAREYTNKMAETLRAVRIAQAKKVIESPETTDDQKKKAREFLRDLDIVNDCSAFFRYVIKNADRINKCKRDTLMQKLAKFTIKRPEFLPMPQLIEGYTERFGNPDESLRPDFLFVSFLSYLRFGDETLQRDIVVKRSTMSRLLNFFSGTLSDGEVESIQKNLDIMYGVINGKEDNPWI